MVFFKGGGNKNFVSSSGVLKRDCTRLPAADDQRDLGARMLLTVEAIGANFLVSRTKFNLNYSFWFRH